MSFLLCPLCGKNASIRYLRTPEFDVDIYAQDIQGLGKGKGFRTTGRVSVLHSEEVRRVILPRMMILLRHAMDEGVLTAEEVTQRLGLPNVKEAVDIEADETGALKEEREAMDQAIEEVVAQMAEALGEDPGSYEPGEFEEDESITKLRYWITRLIDDLMAAKSEIGNLNTP